MSILSNLLAAFKPGQQFTLKEAYAVNLSYQKESVRARIYVKNLRNYQKDYM